MRSTHRPTGRVRLFFAFVTAAVVIGACNDITAPGDTADPSQLSAVAAADATPPTVVILSPSNGATGVAANASVIIRFSEPMNNSTINASTLTLTPAGGSPVAGVIGYHGLNTVSFDVSSPMLSGVTYTVGVSSGAQDLAGNGVSPQFASVFTVAGVADNTGPTVVSSTPSNGAANVAVNAPVTATFSEAMNASTITGSNVTLAPTAGGAAIAATVSYNGPSKVVTLTPSSSLAVSTSYTLTVSTAVKDVAGNSMASPFTAAFTTAAAPDVTSPTITNVTPLNAATGVAVNASVVVTFSEAMTAATVTSSTFTLTPTSGGSPLAANVTYNAGPGTATLVPSAALANNTSYTVSVTSGAKDLANNGLTPFSSTFTTVGDVTAPTVTNVAPLNAATGVALNSSVVVTFSEAMTGATVTSSTFTLTPTSGGSPVAANVSYNAGPGTATLVPTTALGGNTSYTVNVANGARDLANNGLTPFTSTFTTVASGDVTPPTVVMLSPANGATGVATSATPIFRFNETMNLSTINNSSVTLAPVGGSPVAGSIAFHGLNTVQFLPSAGLNQGTTYVLTVSAGAKDLAGNGVSPQFTSSFTTNGVADLTAPTVIAVNPVNAAVGVVTSTNVVVTFSEPMSAVSITSSTFTLTPTSGGSPLPATVSYNVGAATATLTPTSVLIGNTDYTVNVTVGAKDVANNALTAFSSTFKTALGISDITPPTVMAVNPVNAATGVAVGTSVVVTFSEGMTGSTVNSSTFTLSPTSGGAAVPANVTYNSGPGTATLVPSSALANSTSYTVNVTSGAKDLANNDLTPFSSTFTTAAPADVTPPAVTNVAPLNAASGVAVNTNVVVTFSEAMTGATVTSSTFTLTPTSGGSPVAAVVTYSAGPGTATLVPSAALANNTSYTVNVTSGAKDLANNGLTPFSSTFTTVAGGDLTPPTVVMLSPANGATGVAINTTAIFRFSEAMNLNTIINTSVTLAPVGGSPVAGTIAFHGLNTVQFIPSAALTQGTTFVLTVNSGAKDLAGNAVSPDFTSSFATTGTPPDVTPPTVTGATPLNSATNVAVASNVVVNFSEAMNAGTVTTSTFTLTPTSGGSPVAASIVYSAGSATLDPTSDLAYSTSYTVNVTNGAKDLANNGLTAFTSTFTTGANPDVTAPTVTNVTPVNAATNVAIASNVVVTFSEAMNAGTVTTSTFTLTPTSGGSPVSASVVYNAGSATLDPTSDLAYSTTYTINVTTGAKDLANNGLTPFSSTFTTGAPPDLTSPTVTSATPLNAAANVGIASNVLVTFSEAMSGGTVTTSTFTLTPTSGGSPVTASVAYNAGTATLDPASNLAFSTSYTVNVTSGAKDLANNGLVPFSSTFTTAAQPDLTAPTVTNVTPLNAATNVAVASNVVVTFSEAMNATTITGSTFTLTPTAGGSAITGTIAMSGGNTVATLDPTSNLAMGTSYTVNVTNGATDVAGNGAVPFNSTFTTIPPDVTAPTVTVISPADRSVNNSTTAQVRVTFNEPIDPATVNATTFSVKEFLPLGATLNGTRTYESATNTIVFTPSVPYKNHESYAVKVTTGVKDIAGNPLASIVTSCFTPTAGTGSAIGLTGFWSGNDACLEGHWHAKIVQTGSILSLGACSGDECLVYATSEQGRQSLGGNTCTPSNAGGPVLCVVQIVGLTGTVNGSAITFTITTDNGLSFTFNGTFSQTGTANPYLTGTISGATITTAGINFERQGL